MFMLEKVLRKMEEVPMIVVTDNCVCDGDSGV